MTNDVAAHKLTDAPAHYRTARRPGQSGEQDERRAGPSPLSSNPTGPHAPYEPHDPEGLAAGKHIKDAAEKPSLSKPAGKGLSSENISILGEK